MYNRICYTTARLTRHRVHAHVDERLQCKEESKGRDMGGDRRDIRRKHAGTNEQIFCSSTKVNLTHGPSAPPQHRPPCISCPTSVRTSRATSAQRERRRGNRRAVRGLEKASRNRAKARLAPHAGQKYVQCLCMAGDALLPSAGRASGGTSNVESKFRLEQIQRSAEKQTDSAQTVSRGQKVCVSGALQSEGFGGATM